MTAVKRVIRLWCWAAALATANGQFAPLSPCPKIFTYENDGQQWYGKIKLPSPPFGSEMKLRVKMSLGAHLPTKYSGSIEMIGERGAILNNILRRQPISYKVNFPLLHPLPKVTQIVFMGRLVCTGPPESFSSGAQTVTEISLDHTLQTGDGSQQPSYNQNQYDPEPTFDFQEYPNPETFARPPAQNPPYNRPYKPQNQNNDYSITVLEGDDEQNLNEFFNEFVNNQNGQKPRPQRPQSRPPQRPTQTQSWEEEQQPQLRPETLPPQSRPPPQSKPPHQSRPPSQSRPPPKTRPPPQQEISQPPYRPTNYPDQTEDEAINGFLNSLNQAQSTNYPNYNNQPIEQHYNRPTVQQDTGEKTSNHVVGVNVNVVISDKYTQNFKDTEEEFPCGIANVNTLFIKGTETSKGDWPWLVAMYVKKPSSLDFQCAGTLVSHRHVVTAAHCINGKNNRPITTHEIIIKVGVFNLQDWTDGDVKQLGLTKIVVHPRYTGGLSHLDDIAILVLVKRVDYSSYIIPACLWQGNTDLNKIVGRNGTVVGWGRDENGLVATPEPREGKVPIVSTQTCRASLAQFSRLTNDSTLCAGARDGTGPCNGDSGGGMYLRENNRWYLRAIVSLSLPGEDMPCNLKEYVVYTDTAKYLPWIQECMNNDP